MAETRTTRMVLPQWSAGTDSPSRADFNEAFTNLESKTAGRISTTAGTRPAASTANEGFVHFATDTGNVSYSDGSTWSTIGAVKSGTFAARPTANGAQGIYTVTDAVTVPVGTTYVDGGGVWRRMVHAELFTTKGDIFAASGAASPVRLPVGVNGRAIIADSSQATGLKYGDHGDLGGLGDNDHAQYLLKSGGAMTGDLQIDSDTALLRFAAGNNEFQFDGTLDSLSLYRIALGGAPVIHSTFDAIGIAIAANGSETEPAIRFISDHDTGMLRPSANTLAFATGGNRALTLTSGQTLISDGTGVVPGLAFNADQDSGFMRAQANEVAIVTGAAKRVTFTNDAVRNHNDGTAMLPGYGWAADVSVGIYRPSANILGLTQGAAQIWLGGSTFRPNSTGNIILGSTDFRWDRVYSANPDNISSDRRLKNTIGRLGDNEADKALRIAREAIWRFTWKDDRDDGALHTGFIAQDVLAIVGDESSAVEGDPDGDIEDGGLGLATDELIPYLFALCERQERQINELMAAS